MKDKSLFDQVIEARGEYDSAQMAYERAHSALFYARREWERLFNAHQLTLIERAEGKNEGLK